MHHRMTTCTVGDYTDTVNGVAGQGFVKKHLRAIVFYMGVRVSKLAPEPETTV
jgi:hypothetical protein